MNTVDQKIKEILLRENYVSNENIAKAEELSKTKQISLIDSLLSLNIVTKSILGQAVAETQQLLYADLEKTPPSPENILKIPEDIAQKFHVVYFKEDSQNIYIATDNVQQEGIYEALSDVFMPLIPTDQAPHQVKQIKLAFTFTENILPLFNYYKKSIEHRFEAIFKSNQQSAQDIIDEVLSDAITNHASDIHFEPQDKEILVRMRIDGVLHEFARLPFTYYENVVNRFKILAHIRTDEHFSSQDGSIRYVLNDKTVDLRISIVPILNGEKIVLRVLSKYVTGFEMSALGLSEEHQAIVNEAIAKPFGMVIVVGPTGSGKTTTLYSILKILNKPEVNITTIEDPVEYKILGVNHIQVNEQTNLTFSKGLRSIVRQDPDVILVGEIRDKETADIATNASLTGHLLLSTFHANDAATAIPRILDMGVEPFLLASTVELIIAQRLVRKICDSCRYSTELSIDEIKKNPKLKVLFPKKTTVYKGKGCDKCGNIGYRGRTAVYELINVTPAMQDLILQHPSSVEIEALAKKENSQPMINNGLKKILAGETTVEEVLRVVPL